MKRTGKGEGYKFRRKLKDFNAFGRVNLSYRVRVACLSSRRLRTTGDVKSSCISIGL